MLSIIIPIYNVEKYLEQCLNSVANQSYSDFEVILVNDGSTDNSLEIAEKYADNDNRFKIYSKENGGLSSARNYGLLYATKKYITFLDSDDYLDLTIYSKMMAKIVDSDLDIVVSDIQYFYEDSNKTFILNGLNTMISNDINKQAILSPLFAWNKIYRKDYFNEVGIKYPESLWYEDIPVTCPLLVNTEKIGCINEVGYYYRQRRSSIMGQINPKMRDIFKSLNMVIDYFKKNNFFDRYRDELEYLCVEQIMLYGQFRFIKDSQSKKWYEESISFMGVNFSNYKKNKYIRFLSFKNKLFIHAYNSISMVLYKQVLKRK